jgi:hypothetical protein
MKIIINEQKIDKFGKIGLYLNLGGIIGMGIAVWLSFSAATEEDTLQYSLALTLLLIGFIISQISFYLLNRYGRRPRMDQQLAKALKGMAGDNTFYIFITSASYVLLGPAGLWTLIPYYQSGTITYEKNRFRQRGGGIFAWYSRIFLQESIGRPEYDADVEIDNLQKDLKKLLGEEELPPIRAALVFMSPKADLQIEESPIPALTPETLKPYFKQYAKDNPMPPAEVRRIKDALPKESLEKA